MNSAFPRVIALVGPTATGKTALSLALAEAFDGEILSADSRLVYRETDIGTAKPTPQERARAPHHLIDCVPPDEAYSVARYEVDAKAALSDVLRRDKTPIVVGGTGFYIRALLETAPIPPAPPNPALRQELAAFADTHGNSALHQRLQALDPQRAADLHPNDRFRIIRALEIIAHTGEPVPRVDFSQQVQPRQDLNIVWIGLTVENRDWLRWRIDARIDQMLAEGWLAEVSDLVSRYGRNAEALRLSHGYPEWCAYLAGEMSYEAAREQVKINVQQYARRQMTWFRRNPAIHWLSVDTLECSALVERARSLVANNNALL
jgi:tRNA dimethylallyltransferase